MSVVGELDSKLNDLGQRDERRKTQVGIVVVGMLYTVGYILLAAVLVYRCITNT